MELKKYNYIASAKEMHTMKRITKAKAIKKTAIITGYYCNNNCKFCINKNKKELLGKSTGQIISEIIDAKRRGREYLEIIGGEQTIRNDFIHIIKTAKNYGLKLSRYLQMDGCLLTKNMPEKHWKLELLI